MPRIFAKTVVKASLLCGAMFLLALSTADYLQLRNILFMPGTQDRDRRLLEAIPVHRAGDGPGAVRDRFIGGYNLRAAYDGKAGNDTAIHNATDYMTRFARSLRSTRIVNAHHFRVLLQPSGACGGGGGGGDGGSDDLLLLVYVHSAPGNHARRKQIRDTWGGADVTVKVNVSVNTKIRGQRSAGDDASGVRTVTLKKRVIFVMGLPAVGKMGSASNIAQMEAEAYGDILQEDYMDTYTNITYKAISALKYIKEHCMHVPFVLKSDDDAFVNMFTLLRRLFLVLARPSAVNRPPASAAAVAGRAAAAASKTAGASWKSAASGRATAAGVRAPPEKKEKNQELTLYGFRKPTNHLNCLLWSGMLSIRNPASKWYISEQQWRAATFPNYCSGCSYLMTPDVSARLYRASLYTPFFWVDDVYTTGLLPIRMNFEGMQLGSAYLRPCKDGDKAFLDAPGALDRYLFSHCPNGYSSLWKLALADESHWSKRS